MAAVAGPIAGAAIGAAFNYAGGKQAASAAKYAADLQSKSAKEALAFTRQSAEADWRNWEASRKANYGQWQAREGRLGSLGELIGMGPRQLPAYEPSVDPHLDTSGPPQPAQYTRRMRDLL